MRPVHKFCILFQIAAINLSCVQSNDSAGPRVCYQKSCFNVEVVYRPQELMRGLQFRTNLDPGAGMLFVFSDNSPHQFWMKDTLIALDMIWIDYSHRIIHVESNVPPCKSDPCPTYGPNKIAQYVLELNAGKAQEVGLKAGEELKFYLPDLN